MFNFNKDGNNKGPLIYNGNILSEETLKKALELFKEWYKNNIEETGYNGIAKIEFYMNRKYIEQYLKENGWNFEWYNKDHLKHIKIFK